MTNRHETCFKFKVKVKKSQTVFPLLNRGSSKGKAEIVNLRRFRLPNTFNEEDLTF